jgi:hypothetical protein
MESNLPNLYSRQKQMATEFWKSYFAKFQRRIEEHEVSETAPAPLSDDAPPPMQFPDRRISGLRRNPNVRSG